MIHSNRNLGRYGGLGCRCCNPIPPSRTVRTRERRTWRRENGV